MQQHQCENLKYALLRLLCTSQKTLIFVLNLIQPVFVPVRRAGHVARMGEERGCIVSWWGNRREGDQWGDLGVDGWIILGWISRR